MVTELIMAALKGWMAPQGMTISEISDSFVKRSKAFTDSPEVLIAICVLIGLLLLAMLFIYLQRRRMRYVPHGWILDPKVINSVLEMALDQRRTFELRLSSDSNRPLLRCSPVNIKNGELELEAFGVNSVAQDWVNREVEVFFKIAFSGNFTYYAVVATIKDVRVATSELVILRLATFTKLENRQKRSFLRIMPSRDMLLGSGLWYNNQPEGEILNDVSLWPKPDLVNLPYRLNQFTIQDISAGGMRIKIERAEIAGWERTFAQGEHLYAILTLRDPEETKPLRFCLRCRVQNITMDYVTQAFILGLQFIAWADVKEGTATTLEWLSLSKNFEIGRIANWVIKRHLEMFRETPDEERF